MSAIGFYLFYSINWVITLLPLRVLYLFSDLMYVVLYYFPGYRKKIVRENLKNSFPEKSDEELKQIAKKFYRHLADVMVEILKMTHMGEAQAKRRFVLTNPELIDKLDDEHRDVVAICGHYGNWEWMSDITLFTHMKCVAIYKPLKNKQFDWYMNFLRAKNGFSLAAMSKIVREIVERKNNKSNALYAFIADQTPAKGDIQYWTNFLNQDTPVFLGPEKIATKYDMAVIFFKNQKISRGYYKITAELLCEHTSEVPLHAITEAHLKCLERDIRENPANWMWSHRRWKYKREPQNA